MATAEDIDEAEQLRCLALKSMVKRSIKKNSKTKSDESDDNDILLLRAAALKTITQKNNIKKRSLVDKDNKLIKNKLLKGRKRTTSNKVLKMKNKIKPNENKIKPNENINKCINNNNTKTKLSIEDLKYSSEIKKEDQLKLEPETETKINGTVDKKEDVKKIVRNGSIQLSNLDSDKFNETMVLQITFTSSESEDSSTERDSTKPNNNAVKNIPQVTSLTTIKGPSTETDNIESKADRLKNLMQKLVELMQHCETDIKNRDEQIRIFLEAYTNYQNYTKSLYSTLESLQKVRDELASVSSLDLRTTDS